MDFDLCERAFSSEIKNRMAIGDRENTGQLMIIKPPGIRLTISEQRITKLFSSFFHSPPLIFSSRE